MGIPILVSRSGFTAWGVELAPQGEPHADRPRPRQAAVALAGEDRIVFEQDALAYVEDESAKHRRKAAVHDD